MSKIAWIADSHLGKQQYGRASRRKDMAYALSSVVDICIAQGVDEILHCGDIINSTRPSPEDIAELSELNEKLIRSKMTMYVISGNHDMSTPHWIEVVVGHTLPGPAWPGLKLIDKQEVTLRCGLTVFGMPFVSVDEFRKFIFPSADILMMHQAVKEFINFEGNVLEIKDLPLAKYLAILMGDIHIDKQENIPCNAGVTFVGYPGSTEMTESSEDARKHVHFLTIENKCLKTHERIQIPTRGVVRMKIREEKDVEEAMKSVRLYKDMLEKTGDMRAPIVFIEHWNTVPNVVGRFQSNFDPTEYILRFEPVFISSKTHKPVKGGDVEETLDIGQLIRLSLPGTTPEVLAVAEQLVNTDADPDAVLDHFIEERWRDIEAVEGTLTAP
jgi:predicted phosphodiesterase